MPFSSYYYDTWKEKVFVLYDCFTNHHLQWPSQCCQWGPLLDETKYKKRHRLYLSEQTDGTDPNTLVIANVKVFKQGAVGVDKISEFNEVEYSPSIKTHKTFIHPGQVNRIKELPTKNNIVATHTDSPNVLIWDVEAQPSHHAVGAAEACPDLILTGHEQNAQFALAMCTTRPLVLSGGQDKLVVLWDIQDHISTLGKASSNKSHTALSENSSGKQAVEASNKKSMYSPTVEPRAVFKGHAGTVEDVQFCPSSEQEFCSVGDDYCLIFWDVRSGSSPSTKVEKAHNADLHCVSWNQHNVNLILTGSADSFVCMFDRRKLTEGVTSPIHRFPSHHAPVSCVQWSPDAESVFGSATENGFVDVWDYQKVGIKRKTSSRMLHTPSGLLFKHAGHRDNKLLDFHWNSYDSWTMASVSTGGNRARGHRTNDGGTLQIWRMTDSIYSEEESDLLERIRNMARQPCSGFSMDGLKKMRV